MDNKGGTICGVAAKIASVIFAGEATDTKSESEPYTPLDIADPDGRFGNWMPGDDPDDWR